MEIAEASRPKVGVLANTVLQQLIPKRLVEADVVIVPAFALLAQVAKLARITCFGEVIVRLLIPLFAECPATT
jgi:hypothetical protein